MGWEIQKEASAFSFNMPKSNVPERIFEWSADGETWNPMPDIQTKDAKGTVTSIDPKARKIRMRNNSDKEIQLYVNEFTVTTKELPEIDKELMMYDLNLNTYKTINPGEKTDITCDGANSFEFFLSGDNTGLITINGVNKKGTKEVLYYGYPGYIKLDCSPSKEINTLELSTTEKPIRIHQIVKRDIGSNKK